MRGSVSHVAETTTVSSCFRNSCRTQRRCSFASGRQERICQRVKFGVAVQRQECRFHHRSSPLIMETATAHRTEEHVMKEREALDSSRSWTLQWTPLTTRWTSFSTRTGTLTDQQRLISQASISRMTGTLWEPHRPERAGRNHRLQRSDGKVVRRSMLGHVHRVQETMILHSIKSAISVVHCNFMWIVSFWNIKFFNIYLCYFSYRKCFWNYENDSHL